MYYFLNDHLGTPQSVISSSGVIVWEAAYLPFGKAWVKTETITNNFRFPGQYYDEETGLHYNWNRYYDPDTRRYLTPDPIGLDGGINLFRYAVNNPINYTDPSGLIIPVPCGCDPKDIQYCKEGCISMGKVFKGVCFKIHFFPFGTDKVYCSCEERDPKIKQQHKQRHKEQIKTSEGLQQKDEEIGKDYCEQPKRKTKQRYKEKILEEAQDILKKKGEN